MTDLKSKILLMVPHLTLRKAVRKLLEHMGPRSIVETEDGTLGLKLIQSAKISQTPFDLIISTEGLVGAQARSFKDHPLIVIATAPESTDTIDFEKYALCRELPHAIHLFMPFQLKELELAVEMAFEKAAGIGSEISEIKASRRKQAQSG